MAHLNRPASASAFSSSSSSSAAASQSFINKLTASSPSSSAHQNAASAAAFEGNASKKGANISVLGAATTTATTAVAYVANMLHQPVMHARPLSARGGGGSVVGFDAAKSSQQPKTGAKTARLENISTATALFPAAPDIQIYANRIEMPGAGADGGGGPSLSVSTAATTGTTPATGSISATGIVQPAPIVGNATANAPSFFLTDSNHFLQPQQQQEADPEHQHRLTAELMSTRPLAPLPASARGPAMVRPPVREMSHHHTTSAHSLVPSAAASAPYSLSSAAADDASVSKASLEELARVAHRLSMPHADFSDTPYSHLLSSSSSFPSYAHEPSAGPSAVASSAASASHTALAAAAAAASIHSIARATLLGTCHLSLRRQS